MRKKIKTEEIAEVLQVQEEIKPSLTLLQQFRIDWKNCRDRHDAQKEILSCFFDQKYHYIFIRAGRKFSKTTCLIDIIWRFCMENPRSVVFLCYPTITQGIEVVWDEMRLQWCDQDTPWMYDKYCGFANDNKHILRFKNGSYVKLCGAYNKERGRGTQPDLIIYDEVQDISELYITAMDPNISAKNGYSIMAGTPPEVKNHYHEWEKRIRISGKTFHFSSYSNTKLPHLHEWLDKKKEELVASGREDIWKREYLAIDCFEAEERLLPNVIGGNTEEIKNNLLSKPYNEKKPWVAISVHPGYFCACGGVFLKEICHVLWEDVTKQVYKLTYEDWMKSLNDKIKETQDLGGQKMMMLVHDESNSFNDFVDGFVDCREDLKFIDRGFPLLRDLLNTKKMVLGELTRFEYEAQRLFAGMAKPVVYKDFPVCCTLAMMVNEVFNKKGEKKIIAEEFDKYAALRDMGLPCPKRKRKGIKTLFSRIPS